MAPLPYWNTECSADYDLSPYLHESVTSVTIKCMPDNDSIKLEGKLLVYRDRPEDRRELWQCAILVHARTKDDDEEYTILMVHDGHFIGETVKYEEDQMMLSFGMSDFLPKLILMILREGLLILGTHTAVLPNNPGKKRSRSRRLLNGQ